MTNEQINAAIAGACGWTEIQDSGVWHNHKLWGYPPLKPGQGGNSFHYLHDYCNDLNAMHEAEKTLNTADLQEYANMLYLIARKTQGQDGEGLPDSNRRRIWVSARQRAKAFLLTLGKWEKGADKESLTVGGATAEESSADHMRGGTKMMEDGQDAPQ